MAFWHIFEDPVAKTKMSENFTLQWGSEIRTSLDFEWSKRGLVAMQMVRISNGICILEVKSFEIWTNGSNFDKKHLKSRQNLMGLNGLFFKWLGLELEP